MIQVREEPKLLPEIGYTQPLSRGAKKIRVVLYQSQKGLSINPPSPLPLCLLISIWNALTRHPLFNRSSNSIEDKMKKEYLSFPHLAPCLLPPFLLSFPHTLNLYVYLFLRVFLLPLSRSFPFLTLSHPRYVDMKAKRTGKFPTVWAYPLEVRDTIETAVLYTVYVSYRHSSIQDGIKVSKCGDWRRSQGHDQEE